jgi:hypothetical protein
VPVLSSSGSSDTEGGPLLARPDTEGVPLPARPDTEGGRPVAAGERWGGSAGGGTERQRLWTAVSNRFNSVRNLQEGRRGGSIFIWIAQSRGARGDS